MDALQAKGLQKLRWYCQVCTHPHVLCAYGGWSPRERCSAEVDASARSAGGLSEKRSGCGRERER